MKKFAKLFVSLLIPQLVAAAAARFTIASIGSWYRQIARPSWNPPNWVFAPVWTVLYLLMGIALFLVWEKAPAGGVKRKAILFWSLQLLLNFCWSLLFFNQHQIGLALADIVLLWLAILATIFSFAPLNKTAAWLLVPYIAWVSFATMLNFAIWRLN